MGRASVSRPVPHKMALLELDTPLSNAAVKKQMRMVFGRRLVQVQVNQAKPEKAKPRQVAARRSVKRPKKKK